MATLGTLQIFTEEKHFPRDRDFKLGVQTMGNPKREKDILRTHTATKGVNLKVSLKTCYFLTNIFNSII